MGARMIGSARDPSDDAAATINIGLTFDFDGFASWIGSFRTTSPCYMSRGEFGALGVGRVIDLLARYNLCATFFVPGHTARSFPAIVDSIVSHGHEIGHHGWVHEPPAELDPADERDVLLRGLEALEQTAGLKPDGYRAPNWDPSDHTIDLLVENDFLYDSSLMGHDTSPYWARTGDRWSSEEPYVFGQATGLVELPVAPHRDDFAYFEPLVTPSFTWPGLHSSATALEAWEGDLTYMSRHGGGSIIYTMHPDVIGRGYRMLLLEALIERALALTGATVRFMTCSDIAQRWSASHTRAGADE